MTALTTAGFFTGTGGIELGLQQAGFETIYANEIDPYASATYKLNFPDHQHQQEDINNINFTTLPKAKLLTGGFPCQAFSVAGYREGFNDKKGRGNLFFRIADAITTTQPEIILLENVKGLVGHDKGNTFKIILETLKDLGYKTKWEVLNAKDYGNIPQGRERIYIVAFKNNTIHEKFTFPDPIPLTTTIKDFINFNEKVDPKYYYTAEKNPKIWPTLNHEIINENVIYQWRRRYVRANKSGVCPTLTSNMGTGGHNVPLVLTPYGIRKITPRECFNLMGYPTDFKLPTQSDSRLYKQAGNAVVVPVIKRIGEQILKATQVAQTENT